MLSLDRLSIDILAGFAGRTSLGHGAIFGVSTYVVVYTSAQAGFPPIVAFVLGILAATATTLVATGGKEPKGLDLDNPEQRRRFMDLAAEREAKIDRQKQLHELESDLAAASIPIDRLNASNDD